jgi:glyoxylase-like metal-dependent hydrolase (beta-lactamase superfamily II)
VGTSLNVKHAALIVGATALSLAAAVALRAQAPSGGLEIVQVRPNLYMLAGAGANVAVQVGDDGVVVVDAGTTEAAGSIVAEIRKITPAKIRYIINTSADADHVGGNETLSKAGETLLSNRSIGLPLNFYGSQASILAAEKVLTRMSAPTGQKALYPFGSLPTETFNDARHDMYLNGEAIETIYQPAAHSDGDSIVFFRRSDVIVAGELYDTTRFPVIEVARGGSVQGVIAALNRMVEMAIPSRPIVSREAGTLILPGHGWVGDHYDLVHYRDMVVIIRDHVADLIKAGKSLDEIKAAAPAKGYSPRYGADSGPWTTNDFIEAVYKSLMAAKS